MFRAHRARLDLQAADAGDQILVLKAHCRYVDGQARDIETFPRPGGVDDFLLQRFGKNP
jgi:hypothetical protein